MPSDPPALTFGLSAPLIAAQLRDRGMVASLTHLRYWQYSADAVSRLEADGVLTPAEARDAWGRLDRMIGRGVTRRDGMREHGRTA